VNRVEVIYAGKPYSLGNRTTESVRQEIGDALAGDQPYWLKANSGEGLSEDAFLLVAAGIPIAVVDLRPSGDSDMEHGAENSPLMDIL
jgi:hypothetical protein